MKHSFTYRLTINACYFGSFSQSIGSIFAILFIPLRTLYGLSYTQFAILLGLNFFTQVTSDIAFSKVVEKYGFRRFVVCAPLVTSLGILLFAASPVLFPNALFFGFCLATVVFAASAGLQELLLSPIMDAIPMEEDQKAKKMSRLHSSYAWGLIFTVPITSLLVYFLKEELWQVITVAWAIFPLISSALFLKAPLRQKISAQHSMKVSALLKNKLFIFILFAIIFGGSSEAVMAQWSSAFIDKGLALPKILGDMIGVCGFSLLLAIGRTSYGIIGNRVSIHKVMIFGSLTGSFLYIIAAVSYNPFVGIAACVLTGFSVSMLWPGSIIIAAKHLPLAGASMFALLSAAGDLGAASGSFVIGRLADIVSAMGKTELLGISTNSPEQLGLRIGLLGAALFPLVGVLINILLHRKTKKLDTSPPPSPLGHTETHSLTDTAT